MKYHLDLDTTDHQEDGLAALVAQEGMTADAVLLVLIERRLDFAAREANMRTFQSLAVTDQKSALETVLVRAGGPAIPIK